MKYPGMVLHSIGVFLAGVWIFSLIINSIWSDNIIRDRKEDQTSIRIENLNL